MSIRTDSTPLEDPKNPDTCNVFHLYKLIATPEQTENMRHHYLSGGYGYGHAKKELLELILEKYAHIREKYFYYMDHLEELDDILYQGAGKAKKTASAVLKRVRKALGYG